MVDEATHVVVLTVFSLIFVHQAIYSVIVGTLALKLVNRFDVISFAAGILELSQMLAVHVECNHDESKVK